MSTALEQAWEFYSGQFPPSGRGKANCPLHEDATASAVVNLDDGRWRCFAGCGWGDVYELIMKAEGVTFPEAKRIAAEKFGDAQPKTKNKKRKGRRQWKPPWLE